MSNAGEPKAVKARNRRQRREEGRLAESFKWLMGDEKGRRLAVWLLAKAGVNETSYRGNALDMAFREGHRNLGLTVLAHILDNSPEDYMKALDESKKFQKSEDDSELALTQPPEKEETDA